VLSAWLVPHHGWESVLLVFLEGGGRRGGCWFCI